MKDFDVDAFLDSLPPEEEEGFDEEYPSSDRSDESDD